MTTRKRKQFSLPKGKKSKFVAPWAKAIPSEGLRRSRAIYDSGAWQKARRAYRRRNPICEKCGKVPAAEVHHIKPASICTWREAIDPDNLLALCIPCHDQIHAEQKGKTNARNEQKRTEGEQETADGRRAD